MKNFKRSDLACERSVDQLKGFRIRRDRINGIDCIYSRYNDTEKTESITVCLGEIWRYNFSFIQNAVATLTQCIENLIYEVEDNAKSFLIVCLGNRSLTLDALGPKTAEKLTPTRHLDAFKSKVGILMTGVEGQSGFCAVDMIRANLKIWDPDVIITIDSLCSRNVERLFTTVQISSVGIQPGSGVGNHKCEISKATVGKPVISVGVPTVTQYLTSKSTKKADRVADFYISHLEYDIGIEAYSTLISRALENLYFN